VIRMSSLKYLRGENEILFHEEKVEQYSVDVVKELDNIRCIEKKLIRYRNSIMHLLRQKHKFTYEELAERFGLTKSGVHEIMRNR